ncbi:MAG: MBL fold metallo-hydrolase, partial [Paracoccaceae bacterium]|nr:MBL fold metallo-hydrolase [Paracoccaceae bacterium]
VSGDDWHLEAIHTPGHMGNHLCFAWGARLFSGDHVMGWASSLISPPDGDMGAYMASLARLGNRNWQEFHPGHGALITDPAARLNELATHRRAREAAILGALLPGRRSIAQIVAEVYCETPGHLHPAAARNVLAHLLDLAERGLVGAAPTPGPDALFWRT